MEGEDRIDRLNDKLNSRTRYEDPTDKRTQVRADSSVDSPDVAESWHSPELNEMLRHERVVSPPNPFMRKVFIVAVIFFVATIAAAGYIFMGGTNFISSKNVDISILGPTTIAAGEVLDLGVSVTNTNNADLELANLSIYYPTGARNPTNTGEALTFSKEELGVIKAGREASRDVRMVILGTTGETKEIKFSVEYKVKGSNAKFYKDKIYEIALGSAPLTVSVNAPNTITSGEEFTTEVNVDMNATDVLKNVVLKAEYPYGYTVSGAEPRAVTENNLWTLGDLVPGDKKKIIIRGRIIGENEEERTFRFYVGVSDGSGSPNLKIPVASLLNTIAINRSAIGLAVRINGENSETYLAPAAREISASFNLSNNLPDKLLNPKVEVTLSGSALDKNSVRAGNQGIYDQSSSKATWSIGDISGAPELVPGASGEVTLIFASLPATALSGNNSEILLDITASGLPVDQGGEKSVTTHITRKIKISSQVNLTSKSLYSLGPFANHGPKPPKVKETTTYSIVFNIGNTQGDIADAKVTARLGPNVKWLGVPATSRENITYDSGSNTLTWAIGNLPSGTGFSSAAKELAFQVELTPTAGQVGTTPVLIDRISLTGKDSSSGSVVSATNPPVTTRLVGDPAFIQGDDIVVQ